MFLHSWHVRLPLSCLLSHVCLIAPPSIKWTLRVQKSLILFSWLLKKMPFKGDPCSSVNILSSSTLMHWLIPASLSLTSLLQPAEVYYPCFPASAWQLISWVQLISLWLCIFVTSWHKYLPSWKHLCSRLGKLIMGKVLQPPVTDFTSTFCTTGP